MLLVSRQSIARVRKTIKAITRKTRGLAFETIIKELNQKLPGWVRYFKLAKAKRLLQSIDEWIRRRLRCYRLKQAKRTYTKVKMLVAMGVKAYQAWIFALSGKGTWRLSATPQMNTAMNIQWFGKLGLQSLEKVYLSTQ